MAQDKESSGLRSLLAKVLHLKPPGSPAAKPMKRLKKGRPETSRRSPMENAPEAAQDVEPTPRTPSPMDIVHHREVILDSQRGERQDSTALLHSLVFDDN